MKKIHPTAIIEEGAQIGLDVEIGPFCVIGSDVIIGDGCQLKSHVIHDGKTIIGAENILRWLPIGTHNWEKFVKPEDLIKISEKNNLKIKNLDGLKYDIFKDKWELSRDNSVNYIARFKKN